VGKRAANDGKLRLVVDQTVAIVCVAADNERAGHTVTHDMNRIELGVIAQVRRDLH
jgi:hypothetical protein